MHCCIKPQWVCCKVAPIRGSGDLLDCRFQQDVGAFVVRSLDLYAKNMQGLASIPGALLLQTTVGLWQGRFDLGVQAAT